MVRMPSEETPWWSSPRTALAAGLVAVIIVLGLFLTLRGSGTTPPPGDGAEGPATTPAAGGQAPPVTVPGPAAEEVPRVTAPPVTWSLYKGVALPVSATAGPRDLDGDVAAGYAHTPTGALVAAAQVSSRYGIADNWRSVVDRSIARGPGRDVWIATRSKYDKLASVSPGTYCQITGFSFIDYQPSRAVIQLANRCSSGQLQTVPITVSWQDGDWKLVLQPDGSPSPMNQVIPSLDGYVVWGGV
ncbi:MAG: hypothetical protein QG597_179 [Actinomycetota bacterium]|nr:hypothetical protein [Actinomycetota bacterium]